MSRLFVGTRSEGKIRELRELFAGTGWALIFPDAIGLERLAEEEAVETGATFEENAILKAKYFAARACLPTIADDSGIEVDALGGAPGVHSARWGGVSGPDADATNNRLLLERLEGVPEPKRTARYRCVAAYVTGRDGSAHCEHAATEGRILTRPQGAGGFGYDPLFFSTELGMSFGDASPTDKHAVSHRGRAFRALREYLLRQIS